MPQLIGAAVFFLLPDGVWRPLLLVALNGVSVAALVVGTRRERPEGALGWHLLAVGQLLNLAAWLCWYLYPVAASVALSTPSVGDGLFLLSYAVSVLGLGLLARRNGADRRALLDAAILVTAAAVIMWVVFADQAGAPGLSLASRLVNLAYPMMDVVLLAAAVQLAFTVHRSPRSLLVLPWAVLQLVGDMILNVQVLDGSFRLGSPMFAWWLVSFAFMSAAALYRNDSRMRVTLPRRLRLLLLAAGVLPLPTLLVIRAFQSSTSDIMMIAVGSLVVTALVLMRVSIADQTAAVTPAIRALLRRSVARLCVGFVVLALLPLAGLAYLSVSQANSTMDAEVRRRLTIGADSSVAYVADQMNSVRALAASYAERPGVVNQTAAGASADLGAIQEHLVSLQSRNPAFIGVWVMDAQGTMLAFDPPQPTVVGKNFAFRDYFQGVMRTGQPYVSEAYEAVLPGKPRAVAVTAPIVSNGRIVGSIGIGYRLEALASFTARVADVQKVRLTLTDRQGVLLAGPGSAQPGLPKASGDKHVVAALAVRSGIAREAENGVDTVSAYQSIPGLGWAVLAEVPASEAYGGANRFPGRVWAVRWLLAQVLLVGLVLSVRAERRRRIAEADVVKREEHVSSILEAAGDGFISIDAVGDITRWNSQAEQMFGWSAEEALGRTVTDLVVPGEDSDDRVERFQNVLSAGRSAALPDQRIEVELRRRDGRLFPAEITMWSAVSGEDVTFSAFVRDITDRHRYEAELAAARDEALAASRMKSEFVANMSHEIRTPMNGVIGLTTLLLETDLDARQRDYLTTVQNSADALLNVINDILDFSKMEAGKLEINPVDFDVRALAEDVVSLLAATAQAKGLEITAMVHPALPPTVRGDVHRIRQVLTNLVANAVKFTDRGEVIVEVCVGEAVGVDRIRAVEFAVIDTGIGIPADRQAYLFEAFTQVDASTTRRYGGTGLGLTISRQLVELMGGSIGLVSAVDEGSRFHLTLPLPSAAAPLVAPQPSADLAGMRVLIVDDNPTNRKVVQDLLAMWSMRPQAVPDGQTALATLRRAAADGDPFTVALLDMYMPGLDGLQAARAILADTTLGSTGLAMLTSTNQAGEAQAARECGIEVYLTKPVRAAQLRAALVQLLARPTTGAEQPARPATPDDHPPAARILVAEDNEVNQQVAVEMLASLGYAADVAADGEQALRMLGAQCYDAVLMDCQMPNLDGFEATERLRRMPAPLNSMPVIALTASALASDEQRCLDAGMDAFLTKPLRKHHLDAVLRERVASRAADVAGEQPSGTAQGLLDPEALEELREMGPAFVDRVLVSYLRNAPDTAAAIRAAAARDDMRELARLAHKLRGSSGTLAGWQLAATCGVLEEAALASDRAAATALAVAVGQQTELTCEALRTALGAD